MATGIPVAVGELVDVATINSWARGYFRKNTSKTVNTTTTATDLLNSEFTLPAGALGTDKVLRLTAWGDWKQNTGSARDIPAFLFGLGATTLIDTGNTAVNCVDNNASRFGWRVVCEVQNLGASNSQQAYLTGVLIAPTNAVCGGGLTTGSGLTAVYYNALLLGGRVTYDGINTAAVDTTASCAVTFKVKNSNNGANYETKLIGALAEII